jgi:ABC-type multidrug transport system fused ATPase/permease subunit
MDESLPPDTMSARSATEIAERMKQLSQNLGSSFGRLINEIMYPVVRRTLELMDEMGMIELPLSVNGLQIKVVPVAPIAMSQNMEKLSEIMQYVQISQQMGPMGQMVIKQETLLDYIADQLAIPAEIRTTPEERQQIQEMMMQQAQQAAQVQQQQGAMNEGSSTGNPIN